MVTWTRGPSDVCQQPHTRCCVTLQQETRSKRPKVGGVWRDEVYDSRCQRAGAPVWIGHMTQQTFICSTGRNQRKSEKVPWHRRDTHTHSYIIVEDPHTHNLHQHTRTHTQLRQLTHTNNNTQHTQHTNNSPFLQQHMMNTHTDTHTHSRFTDSKLMRGGVCANDVRRKS